MQVTAAVLEEYHQPLRVQELEIDEPKPGDVLVEIVATGVCHTDAIAQHRDLPFPAPGVLGHEGAGIVSAVGDGVTKVAPGDKVIIGWPWCGHCRNCQAGRPRYCMQIGALVGGGARPDGTTALSRGGQPIHSHFFGQSSFATYSMTTERNVVKVGPDAPIEVLGPLGCGISTGAGAIFNALRPGVGSSVAVFGTGAVGLSAVMAAAGLGATTIIAVDVVDHRLELASDLGATEAVNAKETDPVAAIREITRGLGADYSLECTGNVDVLRQAADCLTMPGGTCGVIGGAPAGAEFTLDHLTTLWGRTIRGILGGEGQSDTFLPALVELRAQGRFPFDRLVEFFDLDQANEAMEASARGDVLKPVLRMRK